MQCISVECMPVYAYLEHLLSGTAISRIHCNTELTNKPAGESVAVMNAMQSHSKAHHTYDYADPDKRLQHTYPVLTQPASQKKDQPPLTSEEGKFTIHQHFLVLAHNVYM